MKLLSIDTSTKNCNIALFIDGEVKLAITKKNVATHSKVILALIDEILKKGEINIKDIDAFAVGKGPGSFTGIRIGISTVKGLAFNTNKKIADVSTLEALAYSYNTNKLIATIVDARKNELYFALYKYENDKLKKIEPEQVISCEDMCKKIEDECIFIGTGIVYKDLIKTILGKKAFFAKDNLVETNLAIPIGKIAIKMFQQENFKSSDTILPFYIRKSDAEINLRNLCT